MDVEIRITVPSVIGGWLQLWPRGEGLMLG